MASLSCFEKDYLREKIIDADFDAYDLKRSVEAEYSRRTKEEKASNQKYIDGYLTHSFKREQKELMIYGLILGLVSGGLIGILFVGLYFWNVHRYEGAVEKHAARYEAFDVELRAMRDAKLALIDDLMMKYAAGLDLNSFSFYDIEHGRTSLARIA